MEYNDDASWAAIALYLYGNDWMNILNLTPAAQLEELIDILSQGKCESDNDGDNQSRANPFDPPSIKDYLHNDVSFETNIFCAREKLISFISPDTDDRNKNNGKCISLQEAKDEYDT